MCDAWQRWQIGLAIRDGEWRTTAEITKLVGFAAGKCLGTDPGNFEKKDGRWRIKFRAVKVMDAGEALPPANERFQRPRKEPKKQPGVKQGELFE